MTTSASATTLRVQPAPPRQQLGTPVIILSLILAVAGVAGARLFDFPPLQVAVLPAILCAVARPQFFLMLAVAFIPYTFSLANGAGAASPVGKATGVAPPVSGGGIGAEFGISDVLLLMALPGLLAKAISRPSRIRLGVMTGPILLYLIVGLVSFVVNVPLMHGAAMSFFVAYARSMQIILLIPVLFMAVEWTINELRGLIRAYLYGALVMGVYGIISFIMGQRDGLYILGNHKNGVGLALAFAVLIAAAALTQPPDLNSGGLLEPQPLNINRNFLLTCLGICSAALICSLSRGSVLCSLVGLFYLSRIRKRGRIFGIVLLVLSVGVFGLIFLLPEKQVNYISNYSVNDKNSVNDRNNATRIDQSLLAWKRFEANPLLGDGYRTRKEILPHNLEATLLGETGALGIIAFFWMFITQTKFYIRARKLFTGDPLRETLIVSFSVCAIAIMVHAQFDPYWRRGPLWLPWLGVGIVATMVLQEYQARRRVRALAQAQEDSEWWAQRAERAALRQAEAAERDRLSANRKASDDSATA